MNRNDYLLALYVASLAANPHLASSLPEVKQKREPGPDDFLRMQKAEEKRERKRMRNISRWRQP